MQQFLTALAPTPMQLTYLPACPSLLVAQWPLAVFHSKV
jgi:hypothetical protein